jgi:formate dehydrogenase gamma subunit
MKPRPSTATQEILQERSFPRFTLSQRLEHAVIFLSITVLLLTGLPQKYRSTSWSQDLLSSPGRVDRIRDIHHIAAIVLTLEVIFHLGNAIVLLVRRKLPGDILPTFQDVRDAVKMLQYLLFLRKDKPVFGKYNFEQKATYWFLFFSIGIMVCTGFVLLFPIALTRWLPGSIVPAAKMAHSTEAIVTVIFVVIWHFYHVHIERLNLSIFTGRLNEQDMRSFHADEFEHLTGEIAIRTESGENVSCR